MANVLQKEVNFMKIKKLAAVFAVSALFCFPFFSVSADDTAADEVSEEESELEESDPVTSSDGLWEYTIITDKENNDTYASIKSYSGNDTDLDIPEELDGNVVKAFGKYAFHENTNIKTVNISENLSEFGNSPFFGCTSLEKFTVDDSNEVFDVTDKGALTADDGKLFVCCPPASAGKEYKIPDGVEALEESAFAVCSSIEKIDMPDSLKRINLYCFSECTSLDNVVIPDNVTELGMFAFTGCKSLKNIKLPDNMTTIGGGAFSFCESLSSIEFPKALEKIEQAAFVSTGFTEIEIPYTVTEIGYSAFGYTADAQGQIIPMESFAIKGYSGTAAQSYCGENENVTFVALDEIEASSDEETENEDKDEKNDSDHTVIYIVLGCVLGAAAVTVVIIAIVKTSKKRHASGDDDNTDNDMYIDDVDNDDAEAESVQESNENDGENDDENI